MNKLKYFLFGLITADVGLSLLEGVANLLLQSLEVAKGKKQVQIAKLRAEYESIENPKPKETKSSIGFKAPEPLEEEEESEDTDDDEECLL